MGILCIMQKYGREQFYIFAIQWINTKNFKPFESNIISGRLAIHEFSTAVTTVCFVHFCCFWQGWFLDRYWETQYVLNRISSPAYVILIHFQWEIPQNEDILFSLSNGLPHFSREICPFPCMDELCFAHFWMFIGVGASECVRPVPSQKLWFLA